MMRLPGEVIESIYEWCDVFARARLGKACGISFRRRPLHWPVLFLHKWSTSVCVGAETHHIFRTVEITCAKKWYRVALCDGDLSHCYLNEARSKKDYASSCCIQSWDMRSTPRTPETQSGTATGV